MRLIDADELVKRFKIIANDNWNKQTPTSWGAAFSDAIEIVDEQPTIDPVKHGRWEKDSDTAFYWRCSECGCYLFWRKEDYLLRHEDEPNYCPNCGAKMEESDEEK